MNYKESTCLPRTKELVLTTKKKVVLYEWKKNWKSLLGEKHLLGKPVPFSVKNTANNADTLWFIQHSFSTCIGHQIQLSWSEVETVQIPNIGNSTFRKEVYSTAE